MKRFDFRISLQENPPNNNENEIEEIFRFFSLNQIKFPLKLVKSNMDKTSKITKGKKLVMTTNRITQFTAILFADTGWMAEMKSFRECYEAEERENGSTIFCVSNEMKEEHKI
uniref:Uncharacterized protein n=1 Tax=Glossina pallidipes TaxID=7398 RepID=A0A1B0A0Z6_GLOPL